MCNCEWVIVALHSAFWISTKVVKVLFSCYMTGATWTLHPLWWFLMSSFRFVLFHFFRATTHTDLILRAVEKGIQYRIIHNASIMNAIGCCGLQVWWIVFFCTLLRTIKKYLWELVALSKSTPLQSQRLSAIERCNYVKWWMGDIYVLGFVPILRFLWSLTLCRLY